MTWCVLLSLALASADGGAKPTSNLLRAATMTRSEGATNAARMADGVASEDGDVWDSPRAALLSASGAVEWDLGSPRPVAVLRIQADNNDRYLVAGSLDGTSWYPVWVAGPVELPGVQTRTSPVLSTQARYLRLTAEGGDKMYSIGELEVFDSQQALDAEQLTRVRPPPGPPPAPAPPFNSSFFVVLGVAALVVAYFWSQKRRNANAPPPP
jgi:hypothetical protein